MEKKLVWCRLKIKRTLYIEQVKEILQNAGYPFFFLEKEINQGKLMLNWGIPLFRNEIYIEIPCEEAEQLAETYKDLFLLAHNKKKEVVTFEYSDIQNLLLFARANENPFTVVTHIPDRAKHYTIGVGKLEGLIGYKYKMTRISTDRFYLKILDKCILYFAIPKRLSETRIIEADEKDENKLLWFVARTHHEELWRMEIERWNEKHEAEIETGILSACQTFIPMQTMKSISGKIVRRPLCRGYLFIQTTLHNLNLLSSGVDGIPYLPMKLMKRTTQIPESINEPFKSEYIYIEEKQMSTFIRITEQLYDLVEYEEFDFADNEEIEFVRAGHPLYGYKGILQRKRGKLYIAFGLQGVSGIRVPALQVEPSEIRKIIK